MLRNSDQNYGALWLLTPTVLLYLATFLFPLIMLGVLSFAKFELSVTTLGFYLDNYECLLCERCLACFLNYQNRITCKSCIDSQVL